MVGIILATHGDFAKGILQSGSMIFGDQPNVAACTLQPSMGPEDIKKQMEDAIAGFENQDEVLIMVDLWGGTPFNQANGLIAGHEDKWAIVAGLNLPMLIDAYASRMMMDTAHEVAAQISGSGKEGVRIYPESLEPKNSIRHQRKHTHTRFLRHISLTTGIYLRHLILRIRRSLRII